MILLWMTCKTSILTVSLTLSTKICPWCMHLYYLQSIDFYGLFEKWVFYLSLKHWNDALNIYWNSSSPLTSIGIHIYNPLLKMLEKWSVLSTASENTWLLLACFIFTKVRLNQKWFISTMFVLKLTILTFQSSVQNCSCSLVGDDIFSTLQHLPPHTHTHNVASLLLFPW